MLKEYLLKELFNTSHLPVGLYEDQTREDNYYFHKVTLFNKFGIKIMYGDLSIRDLEILQKSLKKDQFIAISSEHEEDSPNTDRIASDLLSSNEKALGRDFIYENVKWFLSSQCLYSLDKKGKVNEIDIVKITPSGLNIFY